MAKKLLLLPLLALSLMFSQLLYANNSCSLYSDKMSKSLQLDAKQQATIKTISQQVHAKMKANWQQLKSLNSQKTSLITAKNLDSAQLDNYVKQKTAILANMMNDKITAQNAIYNSLNSSQQASYLKMLAKHPKHKKHPHH